MPNIVVAKDLLPLTGTPAFLPSLLSYIRNASSGTLPLDPVIFQAILLCILAGDKHLLLHTPEEDIGLVVRLAAWTLSTIFDLTTQRLRIKPQLEPASRFTDAANATDRSPFLRSLFLRSDDTSGKSKTLSPKNEHSPSRSRKSRPTQYCRSASFPSELSFNATAIASQRPDDRLSDHQPPQVTDHLHSPSTSTSIPRSPPVLHAHTDPAPFRQRATRPVFPHALVVSGLEHAHILDQRALAQVLADKRVVLERRTLSVLNSGRLAGAGRGRESLSNRSTAFDDAESQEDADYDGVWNIPEGFITIYVCPWNTRERPNIHKSLLDKFAMSTTIVVHKSVRQAMRVLPFSSGHPILHPHMHAHSHSNPPTPSLFHASPLPQSRTPPSMTSSLSGSYLHHHHGYRHSHITMPPLVAKELLPSDFLHSLSTRCRRTFLTPVLSIYLADLFSAARHHPQLDGTFLTARAMQDAEDLARASRVLGMDPTGSELVRNRDNVEYSYDEIDDQSTQGRYDDNAEEVGGRDVTIGTVMDGIYPDSDAQTHPPDAGTQDHQVEPEPLYVSEADIARIVPRVITHRLRVRNGPQDEVLSSAVFGATFGNYVGDRRDESVYNFRGTKSTVKDILVGILGDV